MHGLVVVVVVVVVVIEEEEEEEEEEEVLVGVAASLVQPHLVPRAAPVFLCPP
jgi:ABC-type molybdate transport system substrate-binding protein